MFILALQVGVTTIGKVCFIPTSYRLALGSIAISSTIKPSKLIAPTTAGHQTLPSLTGERASPEGFLMTVKAPRGLTHSKRLYSPEQWLERMSEGLQCLGDDWVFYSSSFLPSYIKSVSIGIVNSSSLLRVDC